MFTILAFANNGFPLSREDIKYLVQIFIARPPEYREDRMSLKINIPGIDFVRLLIVSDSCVSMRRSSSLEKRRKDAINPETIENFIQCSRTYIRNTRLNLQNKYSTLMRVGCLKEARKEVNIMQQCKNLDEAIQMTLTFAANREHVTIMYV